jgi:RecA-family ATPase
MQIEKIHYFNGEEIEENQLFDKITDARVLWNEEIKEEKPCIEIIDETGESFPFGTFGNISVITGQAKSRKSFFVTAIASAYAYTGKRSLEMIQATRNEEKRNIVYFDTEQSRFHVKTLINRIIQMTGKMPDDLENLKVYSLRKHAPKDRFEIVNEVIHKTENVGLVIIDGIRDLITNINDPDQATNITSHLMKWSEDKECHILNVIHENKGNEHARGHIGTELINKAETVISIRKEQDNSTRSEIIPTYTRGKAFKNFAFRISEMGMPILDKEFQPESKGRPPKLNITELNKVQLHEILNIAFKTTKELSYSELLDQLQIGVNQYMKTTIGERKTKEFITHLRGKELITKVDPENQKSKFKRS